MLSFVMPNIANDIFMLSLIMLIVVRLNVIVPYVVASLAMPHFFGQALSLTCMYKTD